LGCQCVSPISLKHIYERDILPIIKGSIQLLQELAHSGDKGYIRTIFYYLLSTGEVVDKAALAETLHNHLPPEVEETVMTFADQLRAEGRQEGRQTGWQEGRQEFAQEMAIKLLTKKAMPVEEVAALTGLPLDTVKALASKKSTQYAH
jgi:predicted transposase/invertase (TIGR01784 family)